MTSTDLAGWITISVMGLIVCAVAVAAFIDCYRDRDDD
jgi:hypothetical protein